MSDFGGCVPVAADEFRRRPEGQVQDVVEHKHLAVAARAGANADRRSANFAGDHVGNFARNSLQENAGDSGTVERGGITHEVFDIAKRLALYLESAHTVHGLRSEPDMSGDWNFGVQNARDEIDALFAALRSEERRVG